MYFQVRTQGSSLTNSNVHRSHIALKFHEMVLHLLFGKQQYRGGWKNGGYPDISSDKGFDPTVQTRCVFPIGGGKPGTKPVPEACKNVFHAAPGLSEVYHAVLSTLCDEWNKEEDEFCLGQFHILFGYSQMAHFAYHRDSNTFDKWLSRLAHGASLGETSACHLNLALQRSLCICG